VPFWLVPVLVLVPVLGQAGLNIKLTEIR